MSAFIVKIIDISESFCYFFLLGIKEEQVYLSVIEFMTGANRVC